MGQLTERRHFPAETLGLPAHSVFRPAQALPDGRVVVASDYGAVIFQGDDVTPFPFPKGARKENRDIQSIAWAGGELHLISSKNAFRWDGSDSVRARHFPKDGDGGYEELRLVFESPDGPIEAWRMHTVSAGQSHASKDLLSMATDGARIFTGSRCGELALFQGQVLHQFDSEPIRHLHWAMGRLWIGAGGQLWSWKDSLVSHPGPPPFGLAGVPNERPWVLDPLGLHQLREDGSREPMARGIDQPWSLSVTPGQIWVGRRGGLIRWSL
mgnify:CR=1 FL=1